MFSGLWHWRQRPHVIGAATGGSLLPSPAITRLRGATRAGDGGPRWAAVVLARIKPNERASTVACNQPWPGPHAMAGRSTPQSANWEARHDGRDDQRTHSFGWSAQGAQITRIRSIPSHRTVCSYTTIDSRVEVYHSACERSQWFTDCLFGEVIRLV